MHRWPANKIAKMNAFRDACIAQNSKEELREGLQGPADRIDMTEWGLTANQWRAAIADALRYLEEMEAPW
jgi:hypothetical protein